MATVTRSGVKYIKVSKTDALGNNYDNSWKLNSSIKLNYSVEGLKEYAVNTITEYPTYWLLGLNYVDTTSSIQGAKNYKLSASLDADTYVITAGSTLKPVSFTPFVDSSGYYNTTTDEYVLGVTTNIPIQVTASLYVENTGGTTAGVTASMTVNGGLEQQERRDILAGNAYTFTLNLTSQTYKYGDAISVEVANKAGGPSVGLQKSGGAGKETYLFVTQSVAPASNTLTILNPFFTEPFIGTDCDVTYGWADQVPYSQYYMDVDYADSATIPVNQAQLISGTATPALVKDYYYEARRHTLPRYKGSRASSLRYNEYTGPIADNTNIGTPYGDYPSTGYQGDTTFGKTAAIDEYQSYAARFQYIAGYGPEMYNALLVYVTDIVDELGNVQQPKLDNPSYYNLVNAFNQGEQATVKLLDTQGGTQFASLNNTFNIVRGGKRIETPLFTYTASISGSTSIQPLEGIAFQGANNTTLKIVSNYSSSWEYQTERLINGNTVALNSASLQTRTNSRFIDSDGYKLLSGDNAANANSPLTFRCSILTRGSANTGTYRVQLVKSTSALEGYPTSVSTQYTTIYDFGYRVFKYSTVVLPIEDILNFEVKGVNVEEGYYYNFIVSEGEMPAGLRISKYYVSVDQDIPYDTATTYNVTFAGDKYLLTSSTDPSILSASNALVGYYGSTQVDLVNSGFNQPIPFTIQAGDEIRFVGDETKTHLIYNVSYGGNFLTFNINPPLPTSSYDITTVNSFSIRRYTDDPNTIIVVGNKAAGGTPGGIIKPKYTTKALEDIIDSNPLFTLQSGLSSS